MKPRIYLDTSVIGGCEDEEFAFGSHRLIAEFHAGAMIAVISDLMLQELAQAPASVQKIVEMFPAENVEEVFLTAEALALARKYVGDRVVTPKHMVDAQHIAVASVERVDVLVSWNFKQIVNLGRIRAFNAVNLKLGYPMLEIRSPREVSYEK